MPHRRTLHLLYTYPAPSRFVLYPLICGPELRGLTVVRKPDSGGINYMRGVFQGAVEVLRGHGEEG